MQRIEEGKRMRRESRSTEGTESGSADPAAGMTEIEESFSKKLKIEGADTMEVDATASSVPKTASSVPMSTADNEWRENYMRKRGHPPTAEEIRQAAAERDEDERSRRPWRCPNAIGTAAGRRGCSRAGVLERALSVPKAALESS